jgi:hypothetical protein
MRGLVLMAHAAMQFRTSLTNHAQRRRIAALALVCAAVLLIQAGVPSLAAAQGTLNGVQMERSVKAAFLYKFLGYAEFPGTAFADGTTPFTIGIVGSDDVAAELSRIVAGRTVNSRGIVVRQLRETDLPAPLHLLFVAGDDPGRVARVVRLASGPALVVTECDGGLLLGSAINFVMIAQHVRFDVEPDAAERNGVKLSSRLLTVANRVVKGSQ